MTTKQKRASSIKTGDVLDTSSGPATVLEVGHDPFNRRAVTFTLDIAGKIANVGAFSPGTLLNVAA